jgi:hypothetical protein
VAGRVQRLSQRIEDHLGLTIPSTIVKYPAAAYSAAVAATMRMTVVF